jgi:hypothetical protein
MDGVKSFPATCSVSRQFSAGATGKRPGRAFRLALPPGNLKGKRPGGNRFFQNLALDRRREEA